MPDNINPDLNCGSKYMRETVKKILGGLAWAGGANFVSEPYYDKSAVRNDAIF